MRNAVHRVSDKLHRHKSGAGSGTSGGSISADGKASKKSQIFDKVKTAGGAAILKGVAKKIFSSKSHKTHGGAYHAGGHHSSFNGMHHSGGYYHNYNYRPDRYSEIKGSICKNNQVYEEITFGEFQCPLEGFAYDATFCCGPPNEQYCCSERDYKTQYTGSYDDDDDDYDDDDDDHSKGGKIAGVITAVIGIAFVIGIPTAVLLWLCYRRRGSFGKSSEPDAESKSIVDETKAEQAPAEAEKPVEEESQ